MKKQLILPSSLLLISLVLGVISYFILPETVITQLTVGDSGVAKLPKLLAILIPFALCAGGAVSSIFMQVDDGASKRGTIVSVVGIAVFILMLAVNH